MFKIIDHPADVAVQISSPTRAGLFQSALEAVILLLTRVEVTDSSQITASPPDLISTKKVTICGSGNDDESRLVELLDDLLYVCQDQGLFPHKVDSIKLQDYDVHADIIGIQQDGDNRLVREIKAATYHNLEILSNNGWSATIVLDV